MARADHVVVVGAGLAGLAAAATVREHGVDVVVYEAADAPGGATIESAGWVWRYRDAAMALAGAPSASPTVARLVLERLDDELEWLVAQGVRPLATSTGRANTVGMHIDPREVVERLVEHVGADAIRTGHRITEHDARTPIILASGGYAGDFERIAGECGASDDVRALWVRRPTRAPLGDGMAIAATRGGRRMHADGQCLVRVTLADPERLRPLLSAASELLVPGVRLLGRDERGIEARSDDDWSRATQLRQLQVEHGAGWLELPAHVLGGTVHAGRIGDIVDQVEAAAPEAVERAASGPVRVAVRAGITHTWCGLDIDADARVLGASADLPTFAAGCDAAGSGHGGTASGLAQALVLGRLAGANAARAVTGKVEFPT